MIYILKMSGEDSECVACHNHLLFLSCSATTRQLVEEYEQLQENFVTSATVSQFKQLFLATATPSKLVTGKAPIKCKLKNRWGSKTLQDVKQLVALFGVSGKCLHLSKVEDGCIAVTWLCSTSEVKQLKMAIIDNAESLQTKGVLQVFVGEELVLECTQSDPSVTGKIGLLSVVGWLGVKRRT